MQPGRRLRAIKRIAARTKTNEQARAAAVVTEEQPRRIVRHRTHLERLEARGVITAAQKRAGERLYQDWRGGAEGRPHLVARAAPVRAGARVGGQVERRTAHPRLHHRRKPELVEARPAKDGAPCLRLALDALADHYRAGVARAA
jgi:hypothetical protein